MRLSDTRTWSLIFAVGVIWFVLGVAESLGANFFDGLGWIQNVLPLVLLLTALFDRWAWRFGFLHPHVVPMPVLRGTWRGVLTPLTINTETNKPHEARTIYVCIEQSLTAARVRVVSAESTSDQVSGAVTRRASSEMWILTSVYLNEPRLEFRDRSSIHYGGMLLEVTGEPPKRLEGHYWTDRTSKGKIRADEWRATVATSFEEAELLFKAP